MNNNKDNSFLKENKKTVKLVPPKNFNPRIVKSNLKDERFFAFEAQKSHH